MYPLIILLTYLALGYFVVRQVVVSIDRHKEDGEITNIEVLSVFNTTVFSILFWLPLAVISGITYIIARMKEETE